MKVVQLAGRGIDGCGVTRYIIEFDKWLVKHGYDSSIVAITDKKWSRDKAHDIPNLTRCRLGRGKDTEAFHTEINSGDILIIESLPPKGTDDVILNEFAKVLDTFKGKVVMIQHDHGAHSMARNLLMKETVVRADKIFAHSTTDSDFCRWVAKNVYSGNSLFDDEPEVKILNFQPGMDFDGYKKEFWIDIKEQDSRKHTWLGRTTPWKGYDMMFEWAKELRPLNSIVSLEGLEQSPAFIAVKQNKQFINYMGTDPDTVDQAQHAGDLPMLFREYIHDPFMKRLAKSAFGYQLSRLEPRFIEHSIEYTHCEVAAVGCVPVFRKSYFDNCIHSKTGNKITSDKDTGTIFLPETVEDMRNQLPLISQLTNDVGMRDEWRNMAFEYYKSHQNAKDCYDKVMKEIING